jgi:hypothetical protein
MNGALVIVAEFHVAVFFPQNHDHSERHSNDQFLHTSESRWIPFALGCGTCHHTFLSSQDGLSVLGTSKRFMESHVHIFPVAHSCKFTDEGNRNGSPHSQPSKTACSSNCHWQAKPNASDSSCRYTSRRRTERHDLS